MAKVRQAVRTEDDQGVGHEPRLMELTEDTIPLPSREREKKPGSPRWTRS